MTSAAAVGRLRRSSGEKRVGHGGTLDPSATGVLPIFFGRATVLAGHLSGQGKAYTGEVVLGWSSTTDDAEGELTRVPLDPGLDEAAVSAALADFVGAREQAPPAFSAVKIDGRRSYALARRGEETAPAPREVRLESARLEALRRGDGETVVTISLQCGPGYYVRSLARDLGRSLGTAAHLRSLRRTRVGPLEVEDAIPLEEAEALGPGIASRLMPLDRAVVGWIEVPVLPADEGRLAHGLDVSAPVPGMGPAYATGSGHRLLAIGDLLGGRFKPRRLVEAG